MLYLFCLQKYWLKLWIFYFIIRSSKALEWQNEVRVLMILLMQIILFCLILQTKHNNKVQIWKEKLLSFEDKVVLINNVLNNISIYFLSAIYPPKCVIRDLHKIFARFLYNFKEVGKNKHWVAWIDICRPKKEGRLNFRNFFDISKVLFIKLWWIFRTQKSTWNYYYRRYASQVMK